MPTRFGIALDLPLGWPCQPSNLMHIELAAGAMLRVIGIDGESDNRDSPNSKRHCQRSEDSGCWNGGQDRGRRLVT